MPHQLPLKRSEFCVVCHRTTCWRLVERDTGAMYVCSGEDERHPHLRVNGCGREVPANDFHVRHGEKR